MAAGERQTRRLVLVGNPNVGKSVIFRLLTGSYVMVSNFPGTTVEVSRGRASIGGTAYEVIDTPGVNSLVPQSEDERVTCEILLTEKPDLIVQVADAKNLRRTLLVASQLVEFGLPMILVMNMMDEAQARGIQVDTDGISRLLGIPVVETVAIYSQGKKQLLQAVQSAGEPKNPLCGDGNRQLVPALSAASLGLPPALAVEWLALEDRNFIHWLERTAGHTAVRELRLAQEAHQAAHHRSLARDIALARNGFLAQAVPQYKKKRQVRLIEETSSTATRIWLAMLAAGLILFCWIEIGAVSRLTTPYSHALALADDILRALEGWCSKSPSGTFLCAILAGRDTSGNLAFGLVPAAVHFLLIIAPVVIPLAVLIARSHAFTYELGNLTRRAATGIPILLAVMILIYEFVGFTGSQTLVGLLEEVVFGQFLLPPLRRWLPAGFLHDLFVGPYGLISMGLTYAIAIVLPVVGTFFISFSLLEDSGYLPRLSVLSDRIMRRLGLNGKATLPMVLGFGCCTMATITTRILNSRKERLIATLLLALGIPCSAQLGVILGISAAFSYLATLTVIGVVAFQLLLVGYLAGKLFPGRRSEFIFEIPPIRAPQLRNVLLKTGYRLRWYLQEAVPLFLIGTLALFVMDRVVLQQRSLLQWVEAGLAPVLTGILRVPVQATAVFVLGFLRRDYGAAGLLDLVRSNILNAQQAVVALIVITLFVPCLASFLVIVKEQGVRRALAITGFILPFAIGVGGIVSWFLRYFDITFR